MSEHLNQDFIAKQRQRLEILQAQLQDGAESRRSPRDPETADVRDSGEEGAGEALRSREQALDANARLQLGDVRRALEKIAEGSYGLSDESGEPIPRQRLEAVPEANLTVEEVAELEQRQAATGQLDP